MKERKHLTLNAQDRALMLAGVLIGFGNPLLFG
jgi:hypothetical protein